ncbi:hypothetical protein [Ruania zhangjianzhongii]|uniref:hypothetical protein n=1 Tax=Ruania zhangjianzhongii TaxID=2603206 RepID=UPI0011C9D2A7|nr:hypothetical protein [Ruania zhangjianzhongii]
MALGAAAALLVGLSGCSLIGSDDAPDVPSDGPPSTPGAVPPEDRTIPPQLLECGDPNAKPGDDADAEGGEQVELSDARVATDATWGTPDGYYSADGYYDDLDYEELSFLHTYVPSAGGYDTLDLVGVLGYTGLDWGELAEECGRVPLEAMLERVGEYQGLLGADPLDEAELIEVGGLPAVTQAMSIESYDFRGYWLFSQSELLFIGCQWTQESVRSEIESACSQLVGTVQVG